MNDDEKALFGILFTQASGENGISSEFIDFSLEHYKRSSHQKRYLSMAYFLKSRLLSKEKQDSEAIVYLHNAKEIGESEKNNWLLARIYFDLGQIALNQSEIEKSLDYFLASAGYFEKSQEKNHQANVFMIVNWIHQELGNDDIAIEYSFNALELTTDSITKGNVINGIGYSYFLSGKNDSALYYLKLSLEYPTPDINRSLRNYIIATVYKKLPNEDSLYFYLNQALQYPLDINIEEDVYKMLTDWAMKNEEWSDVTYYMEKQKTVEDSIKKIENQPKITVVERLYFLDKDIAKVKKQRIIWILSIVIAIIIGFLVFIYQHNNKKKEQKRASDYQLELEKKKNEFKRKEFRNEIEKLQNEIEKGKIKYKDAKKKAAPEQRDLIEKAAYNEALQVDNESFFIEKMNKVLNHFPQKLKENYPTASYKEIAWCCLYILDIPTSDISLLLDLKLSSQYKFKQRLAKKLHFHSTKDLEKMLDDEAV
jgi:uncharacterized membrane-anchored protein YhcB (DUF1043 family)